MIDRTEPDLDGFLTRWSRRKTAARKEVRPAEPATAPLEPAELELPEIAAPEPLPAELSDRPLLRLPDVETLDAASDFKPFMQAGVPTDVRNAALRKLWRANPILGEMDGLDDCCGDYTDAAVCIGPIKTIYQVGRGMVDALEELVEKLPDAEAVAEPLPDAARPLAVAEDAPPLATTELTTGYDKSVMEPCALVSDSNRS